MGDFDNSSIEKNSNSISRNAPVALVVGVAGFIGSHLGEKLIEHNIQVIGVDNFLTGKKSNLEELTKSRKFHLLNVSAQNLKLDTPRLDYIYIVATDKYDLTNLFLLAKEHKPKVVLVTSIDLYDPKLSSHLSWYKTAEVELARFAKEYNINARVVRLAEVYGPRMHFRNEDPVTRLIQAAIDDELQSETTALNFSTRALFINDVISLIIKSMMSGGTALKIFDGCLPTPVKVSEIKQILIDPLWYENKGFAPSELPPWPTPNLAKTIKAISWQPRSSLVKSLKETVNYLKEHEEELGAEASEKKWTEDDWERKARTWREQFVGPADVREQQNEVKNELIEEKEKEEPTPILKDKEKYKGKLGKINPFIGSRFLVILGILLIIYTFLYPIFSLGWGVYSFRNNLTQASEYLQAGEFDKSIKAVKSAKGGINRAEEFVSSSEIFRKAGILETEFTAIEGYVGIGKEIADSSEHAVLGTKALYDSLKTISGELTADPKNYLAEANSQLQSADLGFSSAAIKLTDDKLNGGLLTNLKEARENLAARVQIYADLVKQARSATFLLPEVIALQGKKSYLVLLQNNNELRPTGGFIGSLARIDFEGGKLKKLEVQDVYAIDGQLGIHVEPPKEIKEELGQNDWSLRDSNWEPDFPTSARQASWFYTKVTGVKVDGVIAVNLSAMEHLLEVIGPLDIGDYSETISSSNLFERAIAHAEQGFFPGSQAKKNFITALSTELFNQIFFVPTQNWPGIIRSLGKSFEEKQLLVYLADPKLFSYLASENFAGTMPRQGVFKDGEIDDFLSLVEANLGANKSNYYLDRNIKLETGVGKEGEVTHRLRIAYTNRSPSSVWPAGVYKNRMRVYLPFGTKLTKAVWGEKDITTDVNTFVDYGRTAYSMLLEVKPKEQKTLILDYALANKVTFKDGKARYRLDIIKQPGTHQDPLEWRLSYPISYKIESKNTRAVGQQEHMISSDLSQDRRFEAIFTK